ncbi:MAG: NAD(P)/FAD-dependent oxidoreductase [Alphaproteobacteria bacterium]|nr:NAD(P)/FAD-dependent oxidoreductase [Alphaproteobacteria bacterium]
MRPIVVGAGPAGLFAALRLAEAGAPAVLLERGAPVHERLQDVRAFWRRAVLDPDSNVVFGEGGAGAFSDGKIYTRRRDGELGYIFRRLVQHGADPEILEEGWAHLGTDRIQRILPALRERLAELGVELRFHSPCAASSWRAAAASACAWTARRSCAAGRCWSRQATAPGTSGA